MLTVESLNIPQFIARTDTGTAQRGRSYFLQGKARIRRIEQQYAELSVQGTRLYQLRFRLNSDGHVVANCDCPVAEGDAEIICKHKVAGALALRNHLIQNPPVTWETVLTQALKVSPRTIVPGRFILFFSLQSRANAWGGYPYALPISHFTEEMLEDPEALAQHITVQNLSSQVKAVRSLGDPRRFALAFGGDRATLISLLSAFENTYSYYYERSTDIKALLPLLAGGAIFRGTENDPLRSLLYVAAESGKPSLDLQEVGGGFELQGTVQVGSQTFSLQPEKSQILLADPLWLLSDRTIFQVEDSGEVVKTLLENPNLSIPAAETSKFLDKFLLPLAEKVAVTGHTLAWDELNDAVPSPRLYLGEEGGQMLVSLRFGYGEFDLPYEKSLPKTSLLRKPETMTLVRITRSPDTELETWSRVCDFGLKRGEEPNQFVLRARTDVVDFLLKQVPKLTEAGFEIYGERELASARVNRSQPKISFQVSSGIDWFDVDAVVEFGETQVSLKEIRKAVRRKERYLKLADGSIGAIPDEWVEKYRYLFAMAEDGETGLRLAGHQITLLDQLLSEGERVQADEEFQNRLRQLREFKEIKPHALPNGLCGELRPYQKSGYDWLHFLHEYRFGGCLADDMGTGKTIQCLAFLQSLSESHEAKAATLLVLPRSLIFNWEREAEKFTPNLRLLNHAHATRAKDLKQFDEYDLVLTTYGILLRDIEMLRQHRFHYVVLDEAQAIKNPVSQSAKAARLLNSDHRLTLTGTPVENSTLELWSQFSFLNPGLLGTLDTFRGEFAGPIERHQDEKAAAFLRRMVHPFILRRTKDQVATELPPRTERLIYTEMEPPQRKLYDKMRDQYRAQILGIMDTEPENEGINDARMKILEGLLRLRQISNHPRLVEPLTKAGSGKFDMLMETLETLRAEGHKALVFSQFVQMLKIIREALDARGIPYSYLDGSTKDRQSRVDTFQDDPEIPFFLISLKAGGVGLNLTAADYVIHVDPWWNPAVEMQATDRTHRIGQDKPVFVYKLIARDSVEEKILQLQDRKRALVSQLIGTETGLFKSLTRSDIEALFT